MKTRISVKNGGAKVFDIVEIPGCSKAFPRHFLDWRRWFGGRIGKSQVSCAFRRKAMRLHCRERQNTCSGACWKLCNCLNTWSSACFVEACKRFEIVLFDVFPQRLSNEFQVFNVFHNRWNRLLGRRLFFQPLVAGFGAHFLLIGGSDRLWRFVLVEFRFIAQSGFQLPPFCHLDLASPRCLVGILRAWFSPDCRTRIEIASRVVSP